jgi:hypothetical protein
MIEAGADFTCVSSGMEIQCWRRNSFGQLDGGSGPDQCPGGFQCSRLPVALMVSPRRSPASPGGSHTCVIEQTGVTVLGRRLYGQMGNGAGAKHGCHDPHQLPGLDRHREPAAPDRLG